MADVFNKANRSRIMATVRSTGNKATELWLVDVLRDNGIKGWRRHEKLPGKPDFVLKREKVVVFVDGCFWHGWLDICASLKATASIGLRK